MKIQHPSGCFFNGENMSIYFYITSMALAALTGIVTGIQMFSQEDADIFKAFSNTEIIFCLGVSVVLLTIGMICEKRED